MNAIKHEEITALSMPERVSVALLADKAAQELTALAASSQSIVAITNKAGRMECHAAAMRCADARVRVEKMGKQAREDATAFSKAVISKERALVALIEPEESRLKALRDEWDLVEKAAKEAAAEAERNRILSITDRIAAIKFTVDVFIGMEAGDIVAAIQKIEATGIDDSYAEFYGQAAEARADTLIKLREMLAARERADAAAAQARADHEAEQERIKAERAEQARLDAVERERIAAERAELDRQRAEQQAAKEVADKIAAEKYAEQQAALQSGREKLEREQAELRRQQAEIQAAKDAEAAAIAAERAEADRIAAAERAEAERITKEASERSAAAKAKIEAHAAELLDALKDLVEFTDALIGVNECRPLENAKRAIATAEVAGA